MRLIAGQAKIAGLVLPEQSGAVRRRTGYVDCADRPRPARRAAGRSPRPSPTVIFVDHADLLTGHDDRAALASVIDDLAVGTQRRGP